MKSSRIRQELARLARRLRDDRPAPRKELIDTIVSRIEGSRPVSPPPARFRRVALAGVAVCVILTMLAAFGGVGFAASGVSGAAASTVHAVANVVNQDQSASATSSRSSSTNSGGNHHGDHECEDDNGHGAAEEEYCKPRLTICHYGQQTFTLPILAAIAHLIFHYPKDYLGPCRQREVAVTG